MTAGPLRLAATSLAVAACSFAAVSATAEPLSFVGCPIVQDTETVPCWLSEYNGETYYLGIQTDVSADFWPPSLGRKVLVEGRPSADAERICGGIVLEPVRVSPMLERDPSCNTMRPATAEYTVPFAPRPPGPSGGRLAFEAERATQRVEDEAADPGRFVLHFDFDAAVRTRQSQMLSRVYRYANSNGAGTIRVEARRGGVLLSDGERLLERSDTADLRAAQIVDLLIRSGFDASMIEFRVVDAVAEVDGTDDWQTRAAVVYVEP